MKKKKPKRYNCYYIKCDTCGHFIGNKELESGGGASSVSIPSSEVSIEESSWRCRKCTEKHGKCTSWQFPNAGEGYSYVH